MAEIIPTVFLFRFTFPCRYLAQMPREGQERILDLDATYRLSHLAELNGQKTFGDVRVAWNELGLGIQVEVRGKDRPPLGDASRPRSSDGLHVWISTRDVRAIHRADRYCHYFYFLPAGGGEDREAPVAGQLNIPRASDNAPTVSPSDLVFQAHRRRGGYILEAFLPAHVLHGYDPENHPRLGWCYWLRDLELGDQTLTVGPDFPFWEDPSLWCALQLVR
ncbi:MAG: hypothetical protein RMJ82_02170 [Gemmatales bacterium]|nr:hypothetical protein [Gemmatales bacterium]